MGHRSVTRLPPHHARSAALTAPRRWLALAIAAFAAACSTSEGGPCHAGDQEGCACDGGWGYRTCDANGAFGACACEGAPDTGTSTTGAGGTASATGAGGAGGAATGGGGGAGGKLPFMSPCAKDEDCESGLCFDYTSKGPHCTVPCTMDTECPPPSTGCNMKGVCKAP